MAKGLIQGGILEPYFFNIGQKEVTKKFDAKEMLEK